MKLTLLFLISLGKRTKENNVWIYQARRKVKGYSERVCIYICTHAPCVYLLLCLYIHVLLFGDSPVAQMAENLPALQETWVQSLVWDDPLEKGMAIHSSVFAWRIPWTEGSGGLKSIGPQKVRYN